MTSELLVNLSLTIPRPGGIAVSIL